MSHFSRRDFLRTGTLGLCGMGLPGALRGQDVDKRVLEAEQQRIAVVEKVRPSVVAIFMPGGQGGGSGVLISKDGYALSNFHVVGSLRTMQCGLPDGHLYDAVLVGLDKVGDVGLIKLLPREPGKEFPFAPLGDSDRVKAGDWSLAMGNPFLLATDFTPTVTFGLVSGVHRYQYPEGSGLLEYTDCIQIDTSINPGNSGGPLFNMRGELIGINGRGSFDKRKRINSGVGYAISINQIKNFLGHLRAGLDTDHATLGAVIGYDKDDDGGSRLVVSNILDESDARRRGLDTGDELVEFAGRPMTSINHFKNVLGIFPKGWRVPVTYRHQNEKKEILVRLMGATPRVIEVDDPGKEKKPKVRQPTPPATGPAAKWYEAKTGYANYYFNKQERDGLLATWRKHGDFSDLGGEWAFDADVELKRGRRGKASATIREEKDKDGKSSRTLAFLTLDGLEYQLEPLKVYPKDVPAEQVLRDLKEPTGSGGLMMALYHYRLMRTRKEKAFTGSISHGGVEPFYPPRTDGSTPKRLAELRVDCAVLHSEQADVTGKWYFALQPHQGVPAGELLGFEVKVERDDDPCEVYCADYKPVDGRLLPHRLEVHYGNDRFAVLTVKSYKLGKG